ncbi:phosphatase PAP2 family protein [Streptomyces bambusae]|uniref:phosphatase PAP2 family protein n=1 Tax=Streptomyces bambusae TaxID=1550616 RepID=UPI001CFFF335|nr:phosphatase PAP2 family protein [Streptomyces bambusae]MCB5170054.1 phosphatase PAP2 family protein [Streptomyces bambusae]
MSETPRPQGTADDSGSGLPQLRSGHALAHTPHRPDGCPPHTPRGAGRTGPAGRRGTIPPVPGRPALLVLLPLAALVLFALATWQVLVSGPLLVPDERISRAVVRTVPDHVTERLADLGNIPVAVPVLALAMGYAYRRGRSWRAPVAAGAAMALVPAVIVPLKEWTGRPGPLEPWASGYFPSGHTATAAVAYVGAALLVRPYVRHRWPVPAALLLTAATAAGLVLRGFHWPLDVAASLLLSALLLTPLWLRPGDRGGQESDDGS